MTGPAFAQRLTCFGSRALLVILDKYPVVFRHDRSACQACKIELLTGSEFCFADRHNDSDACDWCLSCSGRACASRRYTSTYSRDIRSTSNRFSKTWRQLWRLRPETRSTALTASSTLSTTKPVIPS